MSRSVCFGPKVRPNQSRCIWHRVGRNGQPYPDRNRAPHRQDLWADNDAGDQRVLMTKELRNRARSVFGLGDQAGSRRESVRHKDRYLRQRVDSRLRCSRSGEGLHVPPEPNCQMHDHSLAGSTTVKVRSGDPALSEIPRAHRRQVSQCRYRSSMSVWMRQAGRNGGWCT